jgi:S1-C subfamily serine protease
MNVLILIVTGFLGQDPESILQKFEREVSAIVERTRPCVVQVDAKFTPDNMPKIVFHLAGIVYSAEGTILSDLAGVEGAKEIRVTLHDGRQLAAQVFARDRRTSVALLRVRAAGLKAADFADAASIRPETFAIAVGSKGSMRPACSLGLVTALGRTVLVQERRYDDLIQTTAAAHPGDAGGLLANARGQVIGMIHSRYDPQPGGPMGESFLRNVPPGAIDFLPSETGGMAFATPAPTLKFVAERLLKTGRVVRGYAGITLRAAEAGTGARVVEVTPKGPSARAGVRKGDVLVAFDDKPVTDLYEIRRRVMETEGTKSFKIRVVRGGAQLELDLPIEPEPQP